MGPISRIGARERTATLSIFSISSLNRLLRVSIPDFRKERSSRSLSSKRDAILSYWERSRSMMRYSPGTGFLWRGGGDVWSRRAGK